MPFLLEMDLSSSQTLRYSDRDGVYVGGYSYAQRIVSVPPIESSIGSIHAPQHHDPRASIVLDDDATAWDGERMVDLAKTLHSFAQTTFRLYHGEGWDKDGYDLIYTGQVNLPGGLVFDGHLARLDLVKATHRRNRGIPSVQKSFGTGYEDIYVPRIFGDYTEAPEQFIPLVKVGANKYLVADPADIRAVTKVKYNNATYNAGGSEWTYSSSDGTVTIPAAPDEAHAVVRGAEFDATWGETGCGMAAWLIVNVIGDDASHTAPATITSTRSEPFYIPASATDFAFEVAYTNGTYFDFDVTLPAGHNVTAQEVVNAFNMETATDPATGKLPFVASVWTSPQGAKHVRLQDALARTDRHLEIDTVGGGREAAKALGMGTDGTLEQVVGRSVYSKMDQDFFAELYSQTKDFKARAYFGEQRPRRQTEAVDALTKLLADLFHDLVITADSKYKPLRRGLTAGQILEIIRLNELYAEGGDVGTFAYRSDPDKVLANRVLVRYGRNPSGGDWVGSYTKSDAASIANLGTTIDDETDTPYFYQENAASNLADLRLAVFGREVYEWSAKLDGIAPRQPGDQLYINIDPLENLPVQIRGTIWDGNEGSSEVEAFSIVNLQYRRFAPDWPTSTLFAPSMKKYSTGNTSPNQTLAHLISRTQTQYEDTSFVPPSPPTTNFIEPAGNGYFIKWTFLVRFREADLPTRMRLEFPTGGHDDSVHLYLVRSDGLGTVNDPSSTSTIASIVVPDFGAETGPFDSAGQIASSAWGDVARDGYFYATIQAYGIQGAYGVRLDWKMSWEQDGTFGTTQFVNGADFPTLTLTTSSKYNARSDSEKETYAFFTDADGNSSESHYSPGGSLSMAYAVISQVTTDDSVQASLFNQLINNAASNRMGLCDTPYGSGTDKMGWRLIVEESGGDLIPTLCFKRNTAPESITLANADYKIAAGGVGSTDVF